MPMLAKGSRYTTIIVSIALFLVFDLGVLVLNFYISAEIRDDAVAVNLAGRQRMLSQRTVKTLLQVRNAVASDRDAAVPIGELDKTVRLFDSTLTAFRVGGQVVGASGQAVELAVADTALGRRVVNEGIAIWQPYLRLIDTAIPDRASGDARVNPDALDSAIEYANANNLTLLKLMNDLTNELEGVAGSKADRLRMIQATGITLALINFGIILFHFIGNLRESDRRAQTYAHDLEATRDDLVAAKAQTDEILDTVGEGLFLLDADGNIGAQYSREMDALFAGQRLAGESFLNLMSRMLDGKTWAMTRDFLPLLFQTRLKEKMLRNVNPLESVDIQVGGAARVFDFSFNRVVENDRIRHVLVTVRDVSERVRLARELEASRGKAKEQIELMFGILHVEPPRLREFLAQSEQRLASINGLLRDAETGQGSLRGLIDPVFRAIHSLKGDAGALGLALFEGAAHDFEDELGRLRDKAALSGQDFVALTLKLEELRRYRAETLELVERIAGLRGNFAPDAAPADAVGKHELVAALERLVADLGRELDRPATLNLARFDPALIPAHAYQEVRDILIQLVRNSLAHGIESPAERSALNKPGEGSIEVTTLRIDDRVEISVRDDGRGLMLDKIRARAAERGLHSEAELAAMDKRQLAGLIFRPGFSTADATDRAAGRGVGMDIVRDQVRALNGRLRLSYAPQRGTEMTVALPSARAIAPAPSPELAEAG
ncbi:MAG: type IV pili methyl-accepting chemotaxis transducer N-terminal domain-containing protein [Chromatiales bacterium]|nr:type IV pili methyl-accepting chemotaxis transducer N-terminal domain-containing protein [Chromatiales bacterium]